MASVTGSSSPSLIEVASSGNAQIVLPDRPLAKGSVWLQLKDSKPLLDWTAEDHIHSWELIQQVAALWRERHIDDFVVYARWEAGKPFHWEIIPYSKEGSPFLLQLKVIWRVLFGRAPLSTPKELAEQQSAYKTLASFPSRQLERTGKCSIPGKDPLGNPERIRVQQIKELAHTRLLINYAPTTGRNGHHFLVTTKDYHLGLPSLHSRTYLEGQLVTVDVLRKLSAQGHQISHLYNVNGERAGQTALRWHQHIIVLKNWKDEIIGKIKALWSFLIASRLGCGRLNDQQCLKKVEEYRRILDKESSEPGRERAPSAPALTDAHAT